MSDKIDRPITTAVEYMGALLHAPWVPSPDSDGVIIGEWAEDNSTYGIACPPQLRPLLIELQNNLCRRFIELNNLKSRVSTLESTLTKMLTGS